MTNKVYRDYDNVDLSIREFYKLNHTNQTMAFVLEQKTKFCQCFGKVWLSVLDAVNRLDLIIDQSDPDLNSSQIVHAIQTAESLRKLYPNNDWLHLVGLIHDLGKVLLLPELGQNSQWAVVGDTFPLGCKFSDKIIYYDFFTDNPDHINSLYNTDLGIYQEKCGLDQVTMSWGHDEYLYQVLVHNGCTIPAIGLSIIRYHSFYSWHTHGAYTHLESETDLEVKKWCQLFSNNDLYTKTDSQMTDIALVKDYYSVLIKKYFPKDLIAF